MKNKGHGKAEILENIEYDKIYGSFNTQRHKLIWQLLRYTGERIGAVLKLKVPDVYVDADSSVSHRYITFRASTRKSSPSGERNTRQVPISKALKVELDKYCPPDFGWLFPSPKSGGDRPISRQAYDKVFRLALIKAGLNRRGFSLHSPRRTLITRLSQQGYSLEIIRQITGHKSIKTLQEYIEVSPEEVSKVLETL